MRPKKDNKNVEGRLIRQEERRMGKNRVYGSAFVLSKCITLIRLLLPKCEIAEEAETGKGGDGWETHE